MSEQQQYPTREQIAEALYQANGSRWTSDANGVPNTTKLVDAVLPLFPQPGPSGEPERSYTAADVQEAFERGCVRGEQDANERNWSRRQYEKMQASLPPAEPPSAETIVIDDPVAGRIEQRVKSRTRPPEPSQEQTERFMATAKRFPPTAALEKVWDEGWQAGWANRHQAVPDAEGTVGLSRPIQNPYRVTSQPAAPPSIADMAPGTTFQGRIWGEADDELWFRTALGVVSASGVRAEIDHIDPSTIRDVVAPQ